MEEISSMGIAVGDFDEDLDLDYYISNMAENIHEVNNFDGTFTESAANDGIEAANVVSWGTFYFDFDNDTYLDLFIANGGIMGTALPEPNNLYRNQQNGTFFNIAFAEGIQDTLRSRGAIYGDIDNDGDLDVLIVNNELDTSIGQNISLYKNNMDGAKSWIKINLVGVESNRNAYGAHIELSSNGRTWMREIDGGSSYLSHSSSIAHFGLGNYTSVDSIKVIWPDGDAQTLTNPAINQTITITEFDASGITEFDIEEISIYPNPTNKGVFVKNLSNNSIESYGIYSLDGKLIQEGILNAFSLQLIDVQKMITGTYILQLNSKGNTVSKKISIVH
ncbi:ASPIC/UnbV domain-containing protein [Crocinitomicaceae bacterium]|nr:ASPIC/UnbV domain-containing protein [Crocinitomicaceae bacterium]